MTAAIVSRVKYNYSPCKATPDKANPSLQQWVSQEHGGCPVRCWRSTTPCARAARGLGRSLPMHLRGWLQPSDPTANYDQAARNLVVLSRLGFVNDAQTTKEKSPCQVMSEQLPSGSLALVYHTLWQDALATPRWLSRALCAKQIQKKQHPISSGQATFWNSTPHKPNGPIPRRQPACLRHSVL